MTTLKKIPLVDCETPLVDSRIFVLSQTVENELNCKENVKKIFFNHLGRKKNPLATNGILLTGSGIFPSAASEFFFSVTYFNRMKEEVSIRFS